MTTIKTGAHILMKEALIEEGSKSSYDRITSYSNT